MTRASAVRLWLASDSAQILILVWDASSLPPVRLDRGDEAENGRGLMLVEAISDQWGWHLREGNDGKIVWATCRHYQPAVRLNSTWQPASRRRDLLQRT